MVVVVGVKATALLTPLFHAYVVAPDPLKVTAVPAQTVNAVNKVGFARKALEAVAGIHAKAWLPKFESNILRKRLRNHQTTINTAETKKPHLWQRAFMARRRTNRKPS